MPLPTRIRGPYDELRTEEKTRICFGVPTNIYRQIFTEIIPFRGAQDKIASRLFHIFITDLLVRQPNIESMPCDDAETIINEILNEYAERIQA